MITPTHARSRRANDEGSALVELPITFVVICVFALCITALGQVFVTYQHLSGASRAAARYATKSDYDPTQSPATSSRRPTLEAVTAFAQSSASPLPASDVMVTITPDDVAGHGVTVDLRHTVNDGAFGLVVGTTNRLLGVIGAAPLPPVTVRATSTALYE